LADRLLAVPAEARLSHAYRLLFAREPSPKEAKAINDFLKAVSEEQLAGKPATPAQRAAVEKAAWVQAALEQAKTYSGATMQPEDLGKGG